MALAGQMSPPTNFLVKLIECRGTALPPNVLLMAKLITMCFLLSGQWRSLPGYFLPFVRIFDHMGPPATFRRLLQAIFLLAAVSLLLNCLVRTSCLVLGSIILLAVLSSRTYFENNRLFCGCILFLTGLYEPSWSLKLIRYQVALVYLGAGLNKLLDADWRSGQFFENWVIRLHHQSFYTKMASWVAPLLLSRIMSWTTILTELGLSAGFLVPRLYPLAIWGGMMLHTSMLVLTGRTFGMFYYALLSSYLAFVEWPSNPMIVLFDAKHGLGSNVRNLFQKLDVENQFHWIPFQAVQSCSPISGGPLQETVQLRVGMQLFTGFAALRMILLYSPLIYFLFALILAAPSPSNRAFRKWVAVVLLALFSPFSVRAADAACKTIAWNHQHLFAGRTWTVPQLATPAHPDGGASIVAPWQVKSG